MSLRAQLVAMCALAAALPVSAVTLAFTHRARGVGDALATAAADGDRSALLRSLHEERVTALRRAVSSLCHGQTTIDAVVEEVGRGPLSSARKDALDASLPRMAHALGLDALVVLAPTGDVLGAAVTPEAALENRRSPSSATRIEPLGRRDVALARDALDAGGRPFVATLGSRRALVATCTAGTGQDRALVLGGLGLDRLAAPSLVPSDPGPVDSSVVATLTDARGVPVVALRARAPATRADARDDAPDLVAFGAPVLALLLGALSGLVAARRATEPLELLRAATSRVAAGDLASTLGHAGGPRELRATATAFDRMMRELALTQRKLLRTERIAAWRDIARRIAHEIKNPLQPIRVSIETMRKTYERRHPDFDEIFEESTLAILDEVQRLERIVNEFSRFARLPRPRPEPLDAGEVVAHVQSLHVTGDVPLEVQRTADLPVIRADREQIVQVLVNLAQNAADAARAHRGSDARVRIVVSAAGTGDGSDVGPEAEAVPGVRIEVQDNGPGIPEGEERQRVFEPYYTTKSSGTGLGLAIVHRIVSEHGGTLEIDDAPPDLGGASVRVTLPASGPLPEADASSSDGGLLVPRLDSSP